MKIIKLDATNSTNSFLKELALDSSLKNFTVIVANKQTKGRGQQKNSWVSEPYKNLTASIFIKNLDLKTQNQKYLNFAISVSLFEVLQSINIPNITIKWPNDIMAGNKKICGILIENTLKGSKIKNTIVGIGLNVNQEKFPNHLKNASSLKNVTHKEFDLTVLLAEILKTIKAKIKILNDKDLLKLERDYLNVLYKKNTPSMFKDASNTLFIGMITGISAKGNLLVELENESIKEFGIKEISFA